MINANYQDSSLSCVCENCFSGNEEPCLQQYFRTGLEHNVYVKKSAVHGFGLFARKNLRVKDIICLYSGNIVSETTKSQYIAELKDKDGNILIDGQHVKNFSGRWLNHSARPNARLVKPIGGILHYKSKHAIMVECIRDIGEGDEIFINYGIQYFIKGGILDKTFLFGIEKY